MVYLYCVTGISESPKDTGPKTRHWQSVWSRNCTRPPLALCMQYNSTAALQRGETLLSLIHAAPHKHSRSFPEVVLQTFLKGAIKKLLFGFITDLLKLPVPPTLLLTKNPKNTSTRTSMFKLAVIVTRLEIKRCQNQNKIRGSFKTLILQKWHAAEK